MRALHETGLAEEQREETSRLDWEEVEKKRFLSGNNFSLNQVQNSKNYFVILVTYAIIQFDSSSNSIRRLQMLCIVWTLCY